MNLTLELSGLNLERLLRAAGECGVRMKNVRRVDGRTMRVVVPAAQKKRMAALCEKYGVPCQLSLEERMGCGIGACLGCNVKIMQPDGG